MKFFIQVKKNYNSIYRLFLARRIESLETNAQLLLKILPLHFKCFLLAIDESLHLLCVELMSQKKCFIFVK